MREPNPNGERQTNMSIRPWSRSLPVLAATAIVLAACGNGDSIVTSGPDGTDGEASLRAPTPIEIVGGSNAAGVGVAAATAESDDSASDSMLVPIGNVEYVVVDGLPGLPSDDTGYVYDAGLEPTDAQIEALAAALGVDGEIVVWDDGYQDAWRIGPDDGSAPAVWVYGDAVLPWNYNGTWADEEAFACVAPGSPGEPVEVDASDDEARVDEDAIEEPELVAPECEEPPAPENVPTAAEAETLATELLTELGVATGGLEFETFADAWFASVTVWNPNAPLGQAQQWNLGFGADGALDYASGNLAEPEPVGPYPLIDLAAAVERLNVGNAWFAGAVGGPAIGSGGVAEPALAEPDDVAVEDVEDEVADESLPVEPDLVPQDVTITLVDVEADLWWAWDADGAAWLLPAYRFVDEDGGWHVVPAVTDEFLIEVEGQGEPLPEPEPLPPASASGISSAELADAIGASDDPQLQQLLGIGLEDFERAVADELGLGPVRVAYENGEWLALTADLQPGRVNVAVVDSIVVAAAVEVDPGVADPPDAVAFPSELEVMMGRSVEEFTAIAESFALTVRVIEVDRQPLDREDDFNPTRVNVAVLTVDGTQLVVRAEDDAGRLYAEVSPGEIDDLTAGETPVGAAPVGIEGIYDGVEFYPACGNETLVHEGVTWYQVQPFEYPDVYDDIVEVPRDGIEDDLLGTTGAPEGFGGLRVAPPGPGDDIGTLVVWQDGTARWTSDSGDLVALLTQLELNYEWVC